MLKFYYFSPRGFANEYQIGIATTDIEAECYEAEGFEKVSRSFALRKMTYRGDSATDAYVAVSVDGDQLNYERFQLARNIRKGQPLGTVQW